jgi:hypothetical protein
VKLAEGRRPGDPTVAVVVPLSNRPWMSPDEETSMRQLEHFLGGYDRYLVAPSGIPVRRSGFETMALPRKFFGSAVAHNHLLIWPPFYRAFAEYEYILMYHLDSLVFSDDLLSWCRRGYDYIGAPWLPCADTPWVREPAVGNGGFTLMRVASVLEVLATRYRQRPVARWADALTRNRRFARPAFRALERIEPSLPAIARRALARWRVSESPADHGNNNDYFWAFEARSFLPAFAVAPVAAALQFAFEAAPRRCFALNGGRLPFGCHAWTKFDRAFWEPHLVHANA